MKEEFDKAAPKALSEELVDAVCKNNAGRVRELLAGGATTGGLKLAGEHPVIFANERGFPDVVRAFIDNGMHPDAVQDGNGQSLLMGACVRRDTELVRFLVSKGADVSAAEDTWKWHPLHFAALQGVAETVIILVENGAKVSARNEIGKTACDIAVGEAKRVLLEYIGLESARRLHKVHKRLKAHEK